MACKLNGVKLSTSTTEGRMMYIFQRCMTEKQNWVAMTPTLACAIVGNAYGESGCKASAYNGKDCDKHGNCAPAGGLFGFRGATGEKFHEMVAYCQSRGKDWKEDYEGQMNYFFSNSWKSNWGQFASWYASNQNAGLEALVRGFQTKWEHGSWNDGRLQGAKKMAGLLEQYGEGCTVTIEGGDPSDPCDEGYQFTSAEIEGILGDNMPYSGQGVGHYTALVADSWGVGLVKNGVFTKEEYNVSHIMGSKPVSWFAEQILAAKGEGIKAIILTSGLNSVARGMKTIRKEYEDCLTNAREIGAKFVFVVGIPYTKHKNKEVFNDHHIDEINYVLNRLCKDTMEQYKDQYFYPFYIELPNTMVTVREQMEEGGFHATPSGYRLWGAAIKNSVSKIIEPYTTDSSNPQPTPIPLKNKADSGKTTFNWQNYMNTYRSPAWTLSMGFGNKT